jgi:hypothetical protein
MASDFILSLGSTCSALARQAALRASEPSLRLKTALPPEFKANAGIDPGLSAKTATAVGGTAFPSERANESFTPKNSP